ncbi:pantetheine-phosphate adenylyltransferase [Treponema zuelzerae]|uniref:Phosphopantetheine adenylyltransferase n=1 Tax=Teretinema zuelzerae TaxID=156 RepID=A0AAE3EJE3_9SPIR|nr:pantetheine-phosphate adenylyltransferase [Teretinema zuelzerae]MBN2812009.1 pantetheine-phosphate adenylyltransferase [Spirochaetales bacterium]MCD1654574.1 pantetheine-phosphate adenylyltransferase [Teretinema zuelzerae]HPO03006.1 pantetheine-phosphate adenylyltransferase [Treponemataceae bacterium]
MVKAVFPGSFDPPTWGHLNVIERARKIFSEIHVVVAVNSDKKYLFTEDERVSLMKELVKPWDNVHVRSWNRLIVNYAEAIDARVLIRGVRNLADFSYEFDLAMMNQGLSPDIETVFLATDPKYFVLRSSAIKELASFGGDVSTMVPDLVKEQLEKKFKIPFLSTKIEKM